MTSFFGFANAQEQKEWPPLAEQAVQIGQITVGRITITTKPTVGTPGKSNQRRREGRMASERLQLGSKNREKHMKLEIK